MEQRLEKTFFFPGSDQRKLLAILYSPDPLHARQTGIVYCHPFAEEQNMAHSVAVKACRAFTQVGYPVLRFDMSGCGDSVGNLDETAVPCWLEDIQAAIEVFKRESGVQRVALFGLRTGGGLALLHARNDAAIAFLILWEPVLDFTLYIRQFLRRSIVSQLVANTTDGTTVGSLEKQLADQGMINVIGYPITKRLFDSFCTVSQDALTFSPHCPILVCSISQMDQPSTQMIMWHDKLRSAQAHFMFDHIQAEPFWDRYSRWECPEVIQHTVQWLTDKR